MSEDLHSSYFANFVGGNPYQSHPLLSIMLSFNLVILISNIQAYFRFNLYKDETVYSYHHIGVFNNNYIKNSQVISGCFLFSIVVRFLQLQ